MLKHKTPSSFSGLATARAEINPTRALPVIARAWLRHWSPHAGDLLNALPITACGLRLDDEDVRIAVGLRLGAAICEPHIMFLWSPNRRHRQPRLVMLSWLRPNS